MLFHVTSFFVFWVKFDFVTHLSPTLPVLYARGAVALISALVGTAILA